MTDAAHIAPRRAVAATALTVLVMLAFAGNSILNRMAVGEGAIGALPFAAIRLAAGAAMLAALALALGRGLPLGARRRWIEVPALLVYVVGFSLAYLRMDAGTGALVLFGTVQIVMFGAAARRALPPPLAWTGMGVALSGLVLLADGAADGVSLALMAAAGAGWGVYSLSGRGAGDPLAATAANFVLAAALGTLALAPFLGGPITGAGVLLAVLSGAVTSGLGYALWYAVLPRHAPEAAALWQLTVPALAVLGGVLLLGEAAGPRTLAALALIAGGVALGLVPQRRMRSSGS